ncbi:6-bladed beta-propeller [Rhodohalobacter sp. SW132]|uniref:6-bladed beta-propeller n=1 Tax=Rhodohalobacter sp. SW132 TaxID=2293433 RepID=UPI000E21E6A4|nr:6-bladed beta-propeller [Rhodohalobacter sp. SW132]REL37773.1 6-bladed beta-propeller [Rhodohalobacter sp. SW132]
MKLRFPLIYTLLLFVMFGCSGSGEFEPNLSLPDSYFDIHPQFTEINIPVEETIPLSIDDIADEITLISLDSDDESLFGRVSNISVMDSLILIDTDSNVKYFTLNGDYVNTFESLGHGPGEYITIFGWDVDKEGNKMAIADRASIQLFDLDGEYLERLELPSHLFSRTNSIAFLNSENLLIEQDRVQNHYEDGFSPLWNFDLENGEVSPLFSTYADSIYRFRKMYAFMGYLTKPKNQEIHYLSWVDSDNVYAIDQDKNITLRYRLNFGDYTMPAGALYESDRYDILTRNFARAHPIIETEKYRFIAYNLEGNDVNYAIYDIEEMEIIAHQAKTTGLSSDQYPDLTFWPIYADDDGRLICVHEPENEDENYVLSVISLK